MISRPGWARYWRMSGACLIQDPGTLHFHGLLKKMLRGRERQSVRRKGMRNDGILPNLQSRLRRIHLRFMFMNARRN